MNLNINVCKDRKPEETIQIIQNFFYNLNLSFSEKIFKSECNTWSCIIELIANNQCILRQNGKGMSKLLALASGYAEIFERFCNKSSLFQNPITMNLLTESNKLEKKYYLHPQEKLLDLNYLKIFSPTLFDLYLQYFGTEENIQLFLSYYCNNKIIGIPMYNCFNDKNIIYEDPRLWQKMFNTSGLSAGNTKEEALVQAISEIFERYSAEQFFKNLDMNLIEVSLNKLENYSLFKDTLNKLPKYKEIKIFDLSYSCNVPACLGVIINKKDLNISLNFGSAPTFELTVQRIITELYQVHSNQEDYNLNTRSISSKNEWSIYFLKNLPCSKRAEQFPIELILNANKKDNYNNKIFLNNKNKSYSNTAFLEHYKQICQQNNFNLFYCNNSPIKEMYAIQVIMHNKPFLTASSQLQLNNDFSSIEKNNALNLINDFYKLFLKVLFEKKDFEISKTIKKLLLELRTNKNYTQQRFFTEIANLNWFWPFENRQHLSFIVKSAINSINIDELFNLHQDYYRDQAKKYLMLYDFKNKNCYSKEQIKQIFQFFDIEITDEQYNNILDSDYFFYISVIKTLKQLYISKSFIIMLDSYKVL